jgi:glycosyltransferase A (GT-A) superfamily protein (DUF2064 family)
MEPVLGFDGAAVFARALLDDALGRLCGPVGGFEGELVFAPGTERAWFAQTFPGIELRAQVGASLGSRIDAWFEGVLSDGRSRGAAAVGSDAPWVSADLVDTAFELIADGADVVLGPDMGGGYYLVALARPVPGLFTEIEMSTRSMFAETCAWVRAKGLRLEILAEDYDVDDALDWARLLADLEGGRAPAAVPHVSEFVRVWLAGEER